MATEERASDHVRLNGVGMGFDGRTVFSDLSCSFPRGQISVVLGGSGSGKSTLLRLVAGLIRPTAGEIQVAGTDVARIRPAELSVLREKIGMLFQGGALLDSLTVFDNLAFPLRERGACTEAEIAERVRDRLTAVGLEGVDDLLPGHLSGGMLRRVALARMLVGDRRLWLLDEPLTALDADGQELVRRLLRDHVAGGGAVICATHQPLQLAGVRVLELGTN